MNSDPQNSGEGQDINDEAKKTVKESQPAPISSTSPGAGEDLLRAGIMQQPDQPGMVGKIGRFDVIKVLGQGGMGQVLLAREPATNVKVAIKVLKPQLARDPASVHRFLTEARHAYAMGHPNILKVMEVSDSDDRPFYVVPYIEGGSLARRIGPQKPLPTDTALDIARQVASALSYAHGRGIIHRDLKPANVLMDGEGRAYLTDFGLLRTVFNDSFVDVQQSSLEGTAPYMSPAMVEGKAEDTRCDIYSFGAMLYEMLTGQPPYTAPSVDIILKRIAAGPPEPILKVNPKASKELAAIAEWAMARELRDRYATMADVLSDLERVAKSKEPAGPRGAVGLGKPTRRNLAIAGATVALSLVTFAVWQSAQQRGGFGVQSLPPSLDLVKDFGSSNFAYEAYWDERIPGAKEANWSAASPLHFYGIWNDSNVVYQLYQGAAFFPVGKTFPYVIQATNFGLLTLHPSPQQGAAVAVSIRASAVYEISGTFARASAEGRQGDGVDVAIFRNSDTTNLLFTQHITANHDVNRDAPFDGTGVTSFRLRLPLNQGDTVRFVVFSGRRGDRHCDGTALKAVITPLSPIQQQTTKPATTATGRSSVTGKSLSFDGVCSFVKVGINPFPHVTNTFTIELWASPAASRSETAEANSGNLVPGDHRFAVFPDQGSIGYGGGHAGAGLSIGTNGVSVFEHADNYLPSRLVYSAPITGWTHVALVYSNRSPTLYVNGVFARGASASVNSFVHPGANLGGSLEQGPGYGNYQGQLAEVRIWNTARTATELQANMNRALTGKETGLCGYWRLDEGTNTVISDSSGSGLTGRLMGGTAWVTSSQRVPSDRRDVGKVSMPGGSTQNLMVNGSFELGPFVGDSEGWQVLQPGSSQLPGWTVVSDDILRAVNSNRWGIVASKGSYHLDFTGMNDRPPYGGITQIVKTKIGQAYRLSLDLGTHNRPDNPSLGGPITVSVSTGFTNLSFTHNPTGSGSQWRTYSFVFVAETERTPVTIVGTAGRDHIGVDNVSLVAVSSNAVEAGQAPAGSFKERLARLIAAQTQNVSLVTESSDLNTSATAPVQVPATPIRSARPIRRPAESVEARLAKVQALFKGKVTLRPDGQFEFFYDFSDPAQLDDWIIREPQAEWAVEGGWLVCKKNASNGGSDTRLYHKALYAGKEREISYDAQGPDSLAAGLFSDLLDWRLHYRFSLPEYGRPAYFMSGVTVLTSTNPGALDANQVYRVDATAKNEAFSLAVGGKEILKGSIPSPNAQSGQMAYLSLAYSLGRFDNVRIVGALDPAIKEVTYWQYFLKQADAAYAENHFEEAIKLYDAALTGMEQDQTTDATILKTEKAAVLKQRGLASFIPQRDKLPADKQVEATQTKLRELNPGYNGKGRFVIQERRIVEAYLNDVDIADLSPLKGLPLVVFECKHNRITDLSPLRGMPLQKIICYENQISDLSPLAGMKLTYLHIANNIVVADLSPVKGMPLVEFYFHGNRVADLNPIRGMPLQRLDLRANVVKDLSPLKGMPLKSLAVGENNGISDLSPLKGMSLDYLECRGNSVADISVLSGMPLNHLGIRFNRVVDITPLRECPLKVLELWGNPVKDLSPLKGHALEFFECPAELSDLSSLAGMPIQHLYCASTNVTDLGPLKGMPLRNLFIMAKYIKTGWEAIRQIPTLKVIEHDGNGAGRQTAAEFWKRFDAGEFSNAVPK
jgi:serine/threonine protein kinase